MKKVKSVAIMSCLVFVLSLAAVGCAQHGSDTMGEAGMDKTMDTMNEDKMTSDMEKSMDTMDAEKMDDSMKKDMQHDMK